MSSLINNVKVLFTKRPFVSNCLIYGSLYVGAELSQQVITKKIIAVPKEPIDKPLLGRYAIMGTFIYSPILFTWYKWLDKKLPGTSKQIIIRKLLMDQFLLTPPLVVIFFVGMSLMEFSHEPFRECREKFIPTFQKSCLFWLPAQTINFAFIRPQYRVLYVGTCALIWVNILCWIKRQKQQQEGEPLTSATKKTPLSIVN